MYNVYILQSEKNHSYYIGSAKNIQSRLKQHNNGNVASTRYKKPYKLVFSQEFPTKEDAQRNEKKIKSWKRRDFVERIISDGKIKYTGC